MAARIQFSLLEPSCKALCDLAPGSSPIQRSKGPLLSPLLTSLPLFQLPFSSIIAQARSHLRPLQVLCPLHGILSLLASPRLVPSHHSGFGDASAGPLQNPQVTSSPSNPGVFAL